MIRAFVTAFLIFAPGAEASSINFTIVHPKTDWACAYITTDSGVVAAAEAPLTGLKDFVVRGKRFADPDTVLIGIVPALGVDSTHFTIYMTDSMSRAAMGELLFWSRDHSDNESCLPWHYIFALPQYVPPPPVPGSGGLRGEYYTGTNFGAFAMERTDSMLNFDWALGAAWLGGPSDYYSVRWTGTVVVPMAGAWTLYVDADDGRRLTVDGSVIMDQFVGGSSETAATVQLAAGQHPIKLEYYEGWGAARCILSWSGPGVVKQTIPKGALMP
jgi:hypothetical protein